MMTATIQGYRDLSRHLQASIESGEYASGAQLPTELEMSQIYGMNRHTVRAALQLLENDGYIYRVRGKGTFVTRRKIPYTISPTTSFTASIERLGMEGSRSILQAGTHPAGKTVATHLGLRPGETVVALEILRAIERVPTCLTTSYLPLRRFANLVEAIHTTESLYALLRTRYKVASIRRAWSEIEAAMPSAQDQGHLQMPTQMPVLITRSLVKDGEGAPIEYCISRNRSDAYSLRVDLEQKEARS